MRLDVTQHFYQGMPAQIEFTAGCPFAQFANQNWSSDFDPLIHVSVHSCAFLKIGKDRGLSAHLPISKELHICSLHFSIALPTARRCNFQPQFTAPTIL